MQSKIRNITAKSLSVFITIILVSSIAIPIFGYAKPVLAQTNVDSYNIVPAESLTLNSGSTEYFFVGSTAGGDPMNAISWNSDLNVVASYSNNLAISIGHQTSNTGSYNSAAGNHGIAGIGVSGFSGYSTFTASTPNADTLSTTFTVNSNDLVLILVGGEGDGNLSLSGITAQTLADQTYSEAGSNVIASEAIYEAQLPAGTYNINIQSITYPTNSGTSLGLVVYDFHGGTGGTSGSSSFSDNFVSDSGLNPNLWQVNGPVGSVVGPAVCGGCAMTIPQISFSSGMDVTGINNYYQVATVESKSSFSLPFTAQARVMGTQSHGNTFFFAVSSSDASKGIAILGNLNSGNGGYYGINVDTSTGIPGGTWNGQSKLYNSPQLNTPYDVSISVDVTGQATVSVSSNGQTMGQASYPIGTGSFFVILGEGEGAPFTSGVNDAIWQSASVGGSSGGGSGNTYPVTFTESGLASGASWSVTLNGNTQSSSAGSIVFNEPNGNYQFSVNPPTAYNVVPYSGSITVNGSPVSQALTFVPPVQESGSTPVSMSFTGTVTGPITNMQLTLTSGTITAAGQTYALTGSPGQYCNQNNIVCNAPNGVMSAGFIQLPNNLVLGFASCYKQTSNNQLSLSFYNGRPNTCGGTTAIVQPPSNAFYCPFNATGTLTVTGSQATITASGTGNCNIPNTITVPTSPTSLTATAVSTSQVNLSWNPPTNTGGAPITGYEIQRSISGGPLSVLVANTGSTSTTYSDTSLTSGTQYGYVVSAINSAGVGQQSSEASVTINSGCVTGTATIPSATLSLNYGSTNTNLYDVESGSNGGVSMCYDSSNGLQTSILFSNIDYGRTQGTPAGYPNAGYGYNLYNQSIGSMNKSLQFPMTVQQFSNLDYTSSITYSLETPTPSSLPTDFVYDLWAEKSISSGGPQKGDVEVMIDPYNTYANSQWTQKGTFAEIATVNGNQEMLTWNVLMGAGGTPATVVAFVLPNSEQISSGSISLKLQDFIQDAGYIVNEPISNYNLMGISVGSEFGSNPGLNFLQSTAAGWKWNLSQFSISNPSFTINIISSNGVSSSGPTGNNLNFESSLIKASDGSYNFTLQITPSSSEPGGSFVMLNSKEVNSLASNVLSQLQQRGLLTSNSKYFVSVAPSDVIDKNAVALTNLMISLPTIADSTATSVEAFGPIAGFTITTTKIINDLTNIFPTIPNPPTIVTDVIDNMFTAISQNTEQSLLTTVPICGQNNEQFSAQYVAGPGQEIEIVVTGLAKPAGNTMSLTVSGNNEIIQPATPLPLLQQTSCSFGDGIQGYDGSFEVPIALNIGFFGADYWAGTITSQDPQTQFVNINTEDLQIENSVFDSSASTISSSVNVEGNTAGTLNYTIPVSLDPTNSSSFVLTLNGNELPYHLVYNSHLGYTLNSVISTNGELVLKIPRLTPVLTLSENYRNLVVDGSSFGPSVQLQYYDGSSWVNITNSNIQTTSGNFIYQIQFPTVSTSYLVVKATDNEGDITTSFIKTPLTPIVFASPDRIPDENDWYNKPVTISFSGFSSSTQSIACNSPFTYTGPNGIEITVSGSCSNSYGMGIGNTTINYDSTPPEAYMEFNSITKDIVLYGNDTLSGISNNPIIPTSVAPAKWGDDDNKLDNDTDKGDAQIRTYNIADMAGNTITLTEKIRTSGHEDKVRILSLQYNGGKVISTLPNEEKFNWSENKDHTIKELEQHITIGKDKQDVDAKYSLKDNKTIIHVEIPSKHHQEIKETGLVLLHIASNNGTFIVNGY